MKMKKVLSCVGCAALVLSAGVAFAACGGETTVEVKNYDELVSALNGKASTIKVVEDIDLQDQLNVGRKVTLDLNGKKLFNTAEIYETEGGNWSMISVKENGNLTITGKGIVDAMENDGYGVDVRGGKVTIENGTFVGNISTIYVHHGEAVVNGGNFEIKQLANNKEDGYSFMLNCLDANYTNGTAKITVYGGTFKNFNPAANAAESATPTTNFVAEGYVSTEGTDDKAGYWTVSKAQA